MITSITFNPSNARKPVPSIQARANVNQAPLFSGAAVQAKASPVVKFGMLAAIKKAVGMNVDEGSPTHGATVHMVKRQYSRVDAIAGELGDKETQGYMGVALDALGKLEKENASRKGASAGRFTKTQWEQWGKPYQELLELTQQKRVELKSREKAKLREKQKAESKEKYKPTISPDTARFLIGMERLHIRPDAHTPFQNMMSNLLKSEPNRNAYPILEEGIEAVTEHPNPDVSTYQEFANSMLQKLRVEKSNKE